ncbi:hypothetical protein GCM10027447_03730 [Glycomyces halotolerans]
MAFKNREPFENPVYEFTPPEIADWLESEYLPNLNETIINRLQE